MRLMARRLIVALAGATVGTAGLIGLWLWRHVPTEPPSPPNYEDDLSWLCRPGRPDPCSAPTTATIFEPNGGRRIETYAPDPAAAIDCFYLYPTVSTVRRAYSPIAATADEIVAARIQFARFASVCRPFAPLYRQVTLAGLPALFGGDPEHVNLDVPLRDVAAAWKSYLAKDNNGRKVVLVGHSQGARLLARLMAAEFDGKPLQARLVFAILPGADIDVPESKDVGGSFRHIPLCRFDAQTGCVLAYSAYPEDAPIPADARFGATATKGMRDACVDPAALAGSPHLDADLPLTPDLKAKFGTDFAAFPGVFSAACRHDGRFSILAVGVRPDSRAGETTKALLDRLAEYRPGSGFHSLDISLALGSLVELVGKQASSREHP